MGVLFLFLQNVLEHVCLSNFFSKNTEAALKKLSPFPGKIFLLSQWTSNTSTIFSDLMFFWKSYVIF